MISCGWWQKSIQENHENPKERKPEKENPGKLKRRGCSFEFDFLSGFRSFGFS
jgi:hypothetical protein